jgi:hypothetical protein
VRKIPFSSEVLRELFSYNPETGELLWRPRPGSTWGINSWNAKYPGKRAGTLVNGYWMVGLPEAGIFLAHRVIWKMVYGSDPQAFLDHINGDRSDNRLANLREATRSDNAQNKPTQRNNTSGFSGVHWVRRCKKWQSRIGIGGKKVVLGLFTSPEEAYQAYLGAKSRLHTFNPVPREMERPL